MTGNNKGKISISKLTPDYSSLGLEMEYPIYIQCDSNNPGFTEWSVKQATIDKNAVRLAKLGGNIITSDGLVIDQVVSSHVAQDVVIAIASPEREGIDLHISFKEKISGKVTAGKESAHIISAPPKTVKRSDNFVIPLDVHVTDLESGKPLINFMVNFSFINKLHIYSSSGEPLNKCHQKDDDYYAYTNGDGVATIMLVSTQPDEINPTIVLGEKGQPNTYFDHLPHALKFVQATSFED